MLLLICHSVLEKNRKILYTDIVSIYDNNIAVSSNGVFGTLTINKSTVNIQNDIQLSNQQSSTKFCTNCGSRVDTNSKFCGHCENQL